MQSAYWVAVSKHTPPPCFAFAKVCNFVYGHLVRDRAQNGERRTESPEPRARHLERRVWQRCDRDLCADAESAPSRLMALALAMDMAMKHPTTNNQQPTTNPPAHP